MTLNIITSHKDGLILASDRRTLSRLIHPELSFKHYVGVFYDGFQKVNILKPPHNFVGFVMFGNGAVELDILIEDFGKLLPDQRLSISDYAQRLNDFLIEGLAEKNLPEHVDVSGHSSNIAIAGFDDNDSRCKVFTISPEKKSQPTNLIDGAVATKTGGDTRFVKAGSMYYFRKLFDDLRQKHLNVSKMGMRLSQNEIQILKNLSRGGNIQPFLTFSMMMDMAKVTIEQTAREQVKNDEFPLVGEEIDLLTITPKAGSKFVIHDFEHEGLLKLADSNKHHMFLECCAVKAYIQIHFGIEKPLPKGFIKYPQDDIYTCPKCSTKYDLSPMYDMLLDSFSEPDDED